MRAGEDVGSRRVLRRDESDNNKTNRMRFLQRKTQNRIKTDRPTRPPAKKRTFFVCVLPAHLPIFRHGSWLSAANQRSPACPSMSHGGTGGTGMHAIHTRIIMLLDYDSHAAPPHPSSTIIILFNHQPSTINHQSSMDTWYIT